MLQVLDFLSERARGFILTMSGAAGGTLPEVVKDSSLINSIAMEPLQRMQIVVLGLTGIVAILTIISYGYKFYKFLISRKKK